MNKNKDFQFVNNKILCIHAKPIIAKLYSIPI